MNKQQLLNSIPKVDEILKVVSIDELTKIMPRIYVVDSIRQTLDEVRNKILNIQDEVDDNIAIDIDYIIKTIFDKSVKNNQSHLKRVINGTGIIIHTNLGRSPLCKEAVDAVINVAGNYSNLEYDINNGIRGSRYSHVKDILSNITGAESAMVVNNNAAAVLLVLSSLCKGKEAIVSRGELVEIGGSFRIPDVMEQSGAYLVEVGATNKTHLYDYERAINEKTAILLKVHTSNYRIMGFSGSVDVSELLPIGQKYNIPIIYDIGSGSLIDMSKYGFTYETTVQQAVASGADIITFSGDKMLGGPQAGIIIGKKKYIDIIKENPLTRALRIDKMTIAALEATLKKYLNETQAIKDIPTLRMMTVTKEEIKQKALKLINDLKNKLGNRAEINIIDEYSQVGGGAMPLENIETYAVSIRPVTISENELEEDLRKSAIPIIVRIKSGSIIIDMRTVDEDEITLISDSVNSIL